MNVLFVTQGNYFQLFRGLEKKMSQHQSIKNVGYFVSGKKNFYKYSQSEMDSELKSFDNVTEWEIFESAKNKLKPDLEKISNWEKKYGDPTLWHALFSDRRVYLGKKCVYTQDNSPRFTHNEMLVLIEIAFEKILNQFEIVKPDVLYSFINVSFCEYIYHMIAKKKGVTIVNLRNTKIENYFTASPNIFEPSINIKGTFENLSLNQLTENEINFSKDFISRFAKQRVTYEGQNYLDLKSKGLISGYKNLIVFLRTFVFWLLKPEARIKDNQIPNPVVESYFKNLYNPLRYKWIEKKYSTRFVDPKKLEETNYAFYPLHLEPEMSLLVYSRPFVNQIEVIRWFALTLPVGWKLIIKDHPKHSTYRKTGYYRKLLQIPNVMLINPDAPTTDLIKHSKIVLTICGFTGFEALCMGKPAVGIGRCVYEYISDRMYQKVTDLRKLPDSVNFLLKNHDHNEGTLQRMVTSIIRECVRFDWYSIGKAMYGFSDKDIDNFISEEGKSEQFSSLANFLVEKYHQYKSELELTEAT